MDNKLNVQITANTIGVAKIDDFKSKILGIGSATEYIKGNLIQFASAAFLIEKAFQIGGKAISSLEETIKMGDDLSVLSEKTGVAAQSLSAFSNAAKMANVPMESIESGIKKVNQSLGEMTNENLSAAMKSLGLSTRDASGDIKTADQVIKEVSDRFSKMSDGPRKAALAVQLFGKAGSDLIPLLNMGSKEIDSYSLKMGKDFPEMANRFNDAIDLTNKGIEEQKVAFLEGFLPQATQIIESYNSISGGQSILKELGSVIGTTVKIISDCVYFLGSSIGNIIDTASTAIKEFLSLIKLLAVEIYNIAKGITSGITSALKGDFSNILSGFGDVEKTLEENAMDRRKRWSNYYDRVSERSENALKFSKSLYLDSEPNTKKKSSTFKAADPIDDKLESKNLKEWKKIIEFSQEQGKETGVKLFNIQNFDMATTALEKYNIAQELREKALKETIGWEEKNRQAYLDTTEAVIKQKQALIDLEDQQKLSFSRGARIAIRDYIETIRDASKQTQTLFTNAFQSMEDSLVKFVRTGKMDFDDFVDTVLDGIARIAVQQATLSFLSAAGVSFLSTTGSAATTSSSSGLLGVNTSLNANGNVITSSGVMPLKRFATGGVVNKAHVAVFGEAGAEAFVPLPDGRSIPVTLKANSDGSSQSSNNSVVINYYESSSTTTTSSSDSSKNNISELGKVISSAVLSEIRNQKRPGGLLA